MTHYSRHDWGARAPRGRAALDPAHVEGIALHWPGDGNRRLHGRDAIAAALRGWQDFHMDTRGWSDIAYQVAIDQDGNRWELRHLSVRSAANGDRDVNERFGAALLILAEDEQPTDEMVAGVRRLVVDFRHRYPHGTRIVGHRDIRPEPTECPGPAVTRLIRAGTFNPDQEDDVTPEELQNAIRQTPIRIDAAGTERHWSLETVLHHLENQQDALSKKLDRVLGALGGEK